MVKIDIQPHNVWDNASGAGPIGWTSQGNVLGWEGARAVATNNSGICNTTKKLIVSDFQCNLPNNAVITGVTLHVIYLNTTPGSSGCQKVHALECSVGNTFFHVSSVGYVPNGAITTWSVGGSGNLLGLSSKPEDWNNGVSLAYWATVANTKEVKVDYMYITLEYTLPTYSLSASIPSEKVMGQNIEYTLTLNNTNNVHQGKLIPVTITLPSGLAYVSQSGNGTYNPGTGKWDANLVNGQATLNLVLTSSSAGSKTVTASIDNYNTSISRSTNIINPNYTLNSALPATVTQGQNVTYDITVTTDSPYVSSVNVNVPIPAGFTYSSSNGSGTYNSGTNVWNAVFVNQIATRTFVLTAITPNEYTQTISITGGASLTKNILIVATNLTTPYSAIHALHSQIVNYMQDGEKYTLSCYSKVNDSSLSSIYPGPKNFKIAMKQGANEDLGTRVSALNSVERIFVTFTHNKNETPLLKLYGQYPEISPTTATHRFFGFAIKHGDNFDYEDPGIFFDVPDKLIQNIDYASITIPANKSSTPVVFDNINLSGREKDPKLILKEIGISFDYLATAEVGAKATLISKDKSSVKSLILNPNQNKLIFGDSTNKWDVKDIDLTSLSFILEFNNLSSNSQSLGIKNIEFILYYQYDETGGNLGFYLEDEHCRNYNMFCTTNFDKDEGLLKDISTLDLNKMDGTLIISITNKSKKIKVPFLIVGEDITEMQERITDAVNWMSSDIDTNRRPITKKLIFEWDPNREYEVILADAVPVDYDLGSMKCEATFLLPSGTATKTRITGPSDSNNGLKTVNPVLTIKANGSSSVVINEANSGQQFTINHTFAEDAILYIDFEENKVYDSEDNDYTQYTTLDSDLIILIPGAYDFSTSTGCVVQKCVFKEGS